VKRRTHTAADNGAIRTRIHSPHGYNISAWGRSLAKQKDKFWPSYSLGGLHLWKTYNIRHHYAADDRKCAETSGCTSCDIGLLLGLGRGRAHARLLRLLILLWRLTLRQQLRQRSTNIPTINNGFELFTSAAKIMYSAHAIFSVPSW
jgi:hypothetical protein